MSDKGCTEVYVLHDSELYDGDGLAEVVAAAAPKAGIQVAGNDVTGPGGTDPAKLVKEVKASGADCVMFGVVAADRPAPVARGDPRRRAAGAAVRARRSSPIRRSRRGSRRTPQRALFLTSPIPPPSMRSAAYRHFVAAFEAANGHPPAADAVFGYMAMQSVLQAIADAGGRGDDRRAVTKAFLALRNQHSPLGDYSIDRRGDTTLDSFAGYMVRGGVPVADPSFVPAS